jgi:hypothetical protein
MAPINPVIVRQLSLAALIVLLAMIFIGGEQPGAGALFPPPWDKAVHTLVYGTIGVMVGMAFPRLSFTAIVLVVVGIGSLDEIHQAFLPGREAGFADLFADLIGGLVFLPVLLLLRRSFFAAYSYSSRR